jgi:hypothetical protein
LTAFRGHGPNQIIVSVAEPSLPCGFNRPTKHVDQIVRRETKAPPKRGLSGGLSGLRDLLLPAPPNPAHQRKSNSHHRVDFGLGDHTNDGSGPTDVNEEVIACAVTQNQIYRIGPAFTLYR